CDGAAITRAGSKPVCEASSQSSNSASGLSSRRTKSGAFQRSLFARRCITESRGAALSIVRKPASASRTSRVFSDIGIFLKILRGKPINANCEKCQSLLIGRIGAFQLANQRVPVPGNTRPVAIGKYFGLLFDLGDDFGRRIDQFSV